MTQDQVMGLLRQFAPIIGTIMTTLGFTGAAGLWAQVSGPFIILAGAIWAYVANSKSSIIKSATQMTEVNSSGLADAISDPTLKQVAKNG